MTRLLPPWMIHEIENRRHPEPERPFAELPEYPPESERSTPTPAPEPRRVVVIEL